MKNNIQKRWERHYDYATAYWVDIEKPIVVFDSGLNEVAKYEELPAYYQNLIDQAIDEFEKGFNHVIQLGCAFYECFNYQRFSILREIESFDETIYSINDFNEV